MLVLKFLSQYCCKSLKSPVSYCIQRYSMEHYSKPKVWTSTLYGTVCYWKFMQHGAARRGTALHCTALYCAACCALPCCPGPGCAMACRLVPYHAMQCCAVLARPGHTMAYHAVLYCTVPDHCFPLPYPLLFLFNENKFQKAKPFFQLEIF